MKKRIIELNQQEEEALLIALQTALQSGNFVIAENVVYLRKLILNSPTKEIEEITELTELTNHK